MRYLISSLIVIGVIVFSGLILNSFFGIFALQPNTRSQPTPAVQAEKVKIEDIILGAGDRAVKSGDTIVVNYKGSLANGTQFDSSYDRGTPFETKIGVGQVIKGWDEGLIGMKVRGKRKLTIPASLGYGDKGAGGKIPPNSTLVFEIELLEIK